LSFRPLGLYLLLGLVVLGGTLVQVPSTPERVRISPEPLATTTVTTLSTTLSSTTFPSGTVALNCPGLNLENCGVWTDGNNNTFSVQQFVGNNWFSLTATYLTDPACPPALGTPFFISADFNDSGVTPFVGEIHQPTINTCTRATNPIVENCSQPAIWMTTFNATVHVNAGTGQISIMGQYLNQDWTWDTVNGTITNCSLDGMSPSDFTLTQVLASPTTNSTSGTPIPSTSTSSQGQGTGNGSGSPGQSSSHSSTTNNSTSTHSASSGTPGLALLYVAGVTAVVAVAAVSWSFLRKRPRPA